MLHLVVSKCYSRQPRLKDVYEQVREYLLRVDTETGNFQKAVMRKRFIAQPQKQPAVADQDWLPIEHLADVEVTSEDPVYPVENALLLDRTGEWHASSPGRQTIRLHFNQSQYVKRIWMQYTELVLERTQECVVRWSGDGGRSFREILRQQWNFSPHGSTSETEDCRVDLPGVTVLELDIIPDTSGGNAVASLTRLRLA